MVHYKKLVKTTGNTERGEKHMKRRIVSLVLCFALLLAMAPAALAAGTVYQQTRSYASGLFSDVGETDWFAAEVAQTYELGLMQGRGNGLFAPTGEVSLAEAVTVAARLHCLAAQGREAFRQGTPWYRVYVDYALENGILSGECENYNRAATRMEIAEIIAAALTEEQLAPINTVENGAIPDVERENGEAVYRLYRAGILVGSDSEGTFHPDSPVKRSEIAAIITRAALPEKRKTITLTVSSAVMLHQTEETRTEETPVVDENNALLIPFDLAYPEAFASGEYAYSDAQIMVKFRSGFDGTLTEELRGAGITDMEKMMDTASGPWYLCYVTGEMETVMENVRALRCVVVAEYDFVLETSGYLDSGEISEDVSGNPKAGEEWYLQAGHVQDGWDWLQTHDIPAGGDSSVVVAVIDTGVDYTHEDLKNNIWINQDEIPDNGVDDDNNGYVDDYYGVNLEQNRGSGMDDNGHGTHVAGIIAAANNNIGTVGVAYNVKVMPIKAGMASGYFNQSQIVKAINYAYENGADVINMSFGGGASTIAVQDALENAYTRCVLVASAGNDGMPNEMTDYYYPMPSYPAALSYVVGVMSVDRYGTESSFSNWDVYAYNSVEYEVYAPGTQILSTIPGNRYATWSGTSMAAPYVSAVAALLRSAYPDRDQYPTKFLYGQICSTGDLTAACCNPQRHTVSGMPHNIPKIVDLYSALTKLPKPEVSASDFILFDDPSLSSRNNGDGVIDAGETVAIGFTMRNRWGAAKNVTVHLDATNDIGIACPYISFPVDTVNYGQIGTYATNDFGKTKSGEFVTGLDAEHSLIFTVAEDCPNDYIIRVNLTVTCENDLDAEDDAVYTTAGGTDLTVRRGVILPSIISEDMTWTADNYYIIPNSMTIQAGATVTVEPGTQIQFWSDDPNDAYADTAITYLKVEGTLLCQGTAESHIRMFPSELRSSYRVQFYESGSGTVKLWYTDVVNGCLEEYTDSRYSGITEAYGCEFSQNYRNQSLIYRYLYNGEVGVTGYDGAICADELVNCAFYKVGPFHVNADCEGCIFVDCAVSLYSSRIFTDCVFYGNNNYLGEAYGRVSSYGAYGINQITVSQVITDPETRTTYAALRGNAVMKADTARRLAQYLGGDLCCMETDEEQTFLKDKLNRAYLGFTMNGVYKECDSHRYMLGLEERDGCLYWLDGSAAELQTWDLLSKGHGWNQNSGKYWWYGPLLDCAYAGYCDDSSSYILIEIPDSTITDISVPESEITIDTGMTKQLLPEVKPVKTASIADLYYISSDVSVLTVSQTGLITPVAAGGAVVRIQNADGSVYQDVAVHVLDCVPLEGLTVDAETMCLPIGAEGRVTPVFAPANTTRTDAVYASSDETVATVDLYGTVHAVGLGTAVITVTPAMGEAFATEVTVTVVQPAESLSFAESMYVTTLEQETDDLGLVIAPADATERELVWESSNPEVCHVDENGKLVKSANGTATLRASLAGSDLSAEIVVCITNQPQDARVEEIQYTGNGEYNYYIYYARLSDGSLWRWGYGLKTPEKLPFENVAGFMVSNNDMIYVLSGDGTLQCYSTTGALYDSGGYWNTDGTIYHSYGYNLFNNYKPMTGVQSVSTTLGNYYKAFYALKEDGSVWAWGNGEYGQLGDGTNSNRSQAVQVDLPGNCVDVCARSGFAVFLLENGDVYYTGSYGNGRNYTPWKLTDGASGISPCLDSQCCFTIRKKDTVILYSETRIIQTYSVSGDGYSFGDYRDFYIDGGTVFGKGNNYCGQLGVGDTESHSAYTQMLKITNAVRAFNFEYTTFIQTENGFYGVGYNGGRALADLTTESRSVPVRIFFGLAENEGGFRMEQNNLSGDGPYLLQESRLVLDYNEALVKGGNYGSVSLRNSMGDQLSVRRTIRLDQLIIEPVAHFTEGETYTLTLPADALQTKFGTTSEAVSFTFTYHAPAPKAPDPVDTLALARTLYLAEIPADGPKDGADLGELTALLGLSASFVGEAKTLIWTVSDPETAWISTTGHLFARRPGCVTLTVSMEGTALSAFALVYVSVEDAPVTVTKREGNTVLFSDHMIYMVQPDTAPVTITAPADDPVSFGENMVYLIRPDTAPVTVSSHAADFHREDGCLWIRDTEGVITRDGVETQDTAPALRFSNLISGFGETILLNTDTLVLTMDRELFFGNQGQEFLGENGLSGFYTISGKELTVHFNALTPGIHCSLTVPAGTVRTYLGAEAEELTLEFVYREKLTENAASMLGENRPVTVLSSGAVSDDLAAQARTWTEARILGCWDDFCDEGYNTLFFGNVILNRFTENNVEKWLRIQAPGSDTYQRYGVGGNYWGTAGLNEKAKKLAIDKQIIDYNDYQQYADLNEGTILETIPETVWPVVSRVGILDEEGSEVTAVSRAQMLFFVEFNIDMDTTVPLQVRFGSSYPYGDYEISGRWVSARRWEGSYAISALIANGNQYWSIANGVSAEGWKLYKDWARFSFTVDTTSALAMTMQAESDDEGIILTWEQDDFDTLAGYNVYRSTTENGQYSKINTTVIPADTRTWRDTNVEPGKQYFYNFTVVKTDMTESGTSGKIAAFAKDTMAPNMYHSPVYSAFTGSNLVVNATVTDNVQVEKVVLFYRTAGEEQWHESQMGKLGDKYSAIIPSQLITTDGLEYYIRAFDGVSYTYKGSAEEPYFVSVSQAVETNAMGDVNGDGRITVFDALLILQQLNNMVNLTAEEFARGDLNGDGQLSSAEAMRIVQYANGVIGSVLY